ncbi:MAG: GNAT family N-acetyltransferase [Rubellimicrobium sp.]|nr:GNAT family N-acetyltransferase [Rubellimicrobium sp.]
MDDRPRGEIISGWTPAPLPGPDVIDGRFARLERLDPARHGADLADAWLGHDWLWDYMFRGPFDDAAGIGAYLRDIAGQPDPYFYAIRDLAGGRAAGVASLMRITPVMGVVEVGNICLAPALQQTPAATEAMFLLMAWAFDNGYRRYEWKCDALNRPSRRAAQRLGFSFESIFRQHMIVKGRSRDTAWFAIIDREWPALRAAYERWLAPGNFDASGRQRHSLSALTRPLLFARDPLLQDAG